MEPIIFVFKTVFIQFIIFTIYFFSALICWLLKDWINIPWAIKMSISTFIVGIIYLFFSYIFWPNFYVSILFFVSLSVFWFSEFFGFKRTKAFLVGILYGLFISILSWIIIKIL